MSSLDHRTPLLAGSKSGESKSHIKVSKSLKGSRSRGVKENTIVQDEEEVKEPILPDDWKCNFAERELLRLERERRMQLQETKLNHILNMRRNSKKMSSFLKQFQEWSRQVQIEDAETLKRIEEEAELVAERELQTSLYKHEDAQIRQQRVMASIKAMEEERNLLEAVEEMRTLSNALQQVESLLESMIASAKNMQLKCLETCLALLNDTKELEKTIVNCIAQKDISRNVRSSVANVIERVESTRIKLEKETDEFQRKEREKQNQEAQQEAAEMAKQMQEQKEREQAEELRRVQQEQQMKAKENVEIAQAADDNHVFQGSRLLGSRKNQERFLNAQQICSDLEAQIAPLENSESDKDLRFMCKKAVNIPVNAISAVSSSHLKDKYERLKRLLEGQDINVDEKKLNVSGHPLGIAFCSNVIAKKIVSQGADIVSSKPELAFPLALVTNSLWASRPNFGKLFLSHLFRSCPYLIPINFQTDSLDEEDKVSKISGMARLYGALVVSPLASDVNDHPHPHGLGNLWTWFASQLNMDPIHDVTATVIHNILDTAGHALMEKYGKMFHKLMRVLEESYLPRIRSVTKEGFDASLSRLEEFLNKYNKNGRISRPKDLLEQGFI